MTKATKDDLIAHVTHLREHLAALLASHADLIDFANGKVESVDTEWARRIHARAETARFEPMDRTTRGSLQKSAE